MHLKVNSENKKSGASSVRAGLRVSSNAFASFIEYQITFALRLQKVQFETTKLDYILKTKFCSILYLGSMYFC